MGLIKQKMVRGIPCVYWKLTAISSDLLHNTTTLSMAIYFSQEARLQNAENIQEYVSVNVEGVGFSVKEAYLLVKKPKFGTDLVDGNPVPVQKNWFADAVDVFESEKVEEPPHVSPPPAVKKVTKPRRKKAESM